MSRHLELIRAVNEATTHDERQRALWYLDGWREGRRSAGRPVDLMEGDLYYIEAGIERPMCCGVWLDWTPQATS